ncbi:MAG: hypothetical protein ACLFN8_03735 [Candidatus Woesearchaeota archaeon]
MNPKKNKWILIIILIISLFLIQGCDNNRPGEPINFYRGSDGLTIKFLNNAPPDRVIENTQTTVMMELANRGAHTVPRGDAIVYLRYNTMHFSTDVTDQGFELSRNPTGIMGQISGKSETWPQGEFTIFPLAKLNVQKIIGTMEAPKTDIELITCYKYKTYLTEMICLDTDIYEVDSNPICRNRGKFSYSNQGAPIAITQLEVDMLPMGFVDVTPGSPANVPIINETGELIGIAPRTTTESLILLEPVIRIHSRNVGRGSVFLSKNPELTTPYVCAFNQQSQYTELAALNQDFNKVKLSNATLDGFEMNCDKNTLNLANPNDFISCRLNPEQVGYLRQNFEVPLSIELEYYYRQSQTKTIEIQRTR